MSFEGVPFSVSYGSGDPTALVASGTTAQCGVPANISMTIPVNLVAGSLYLLGNAAGDVAQPDTSFSVTITYSDSTTASGSLVDTVSGSTTGLIEFSCWATAGHDLPASAVYSATLSSGGATCNGSPGANPTAYVYVYSVALDPTKMTSHVTISTSSTYTGFIYAATADTLSTTAVPTATATAIQATSTPSTAITTCAQYLAANPGAPNGEYLLYVGGAFVKIYCYNMNGTPTEYLTLPNSAAPGSAFGAVGSLSSHTFPDGSNYSSIAQNGSTSLLVTVYTKVRFLPATLQVKIDDPTFATNTSGTPGSGGGFAPYGYAEGCTNDDGFSNVDLTATSFAVSDSFGFSGIPGAAYVNGTTTTGSISVTNTQVVNLGGEGTCGGAVPSAFGATTPQPYLQLALNSTVATVTPSSTATGTATATATVTSTTTGTPNPAGPGSALQFGGFSWVAIPASASLTLTNQFTLEAWVDQAALTGDLQTAVGQGSGSAGTGYTLDTDANGFPGFGLNDGATANCGFSASQALTTGHWTHLAATFDGTTMTLYVNGVSQGTSTCFSGKTLAATAQPVYIGRELTTSFPRYFKGAIDEVRIWNQARTATAIQSTMNTTLAGTESGLVGYWKFDAGSGVSAGDSTANGNTGLLAGDTLPAWITSGALLAAPTATSTSTATATATSTTTPMPVTTPSHSLVFDGTSGYLSSSLVETNVTAYTMETWVKTTTTGNSVLLSDRGPSTPGLILQLNNGYVMYGVNGGGIFVASSTGTQINDGNWHHVAGVFSGSSGVSPTLSQITLYVDGVANTSCTPGCPNTSNAPTAPFSGDSTGTTAAESLEPSLMTAPYIYAGSLADIRLWNVARSASNVASDYSGTSPVGQTGLQAYWPLLEGAGTSTADQSGNGFTANLNGGVTWACTCPTVTATGTSTSTATVTATATATQTATATATATATSTATAVPGIASFALQFDGTSSYVNVPTSPNLAGSSFTLEAWAQVGSLPSSGWLIGQGTNTTDHGLHFGLGTDTSFKCGFWADDLTVTIPMDSGWHHWACTFDASTLTRTIYRDGVNMSSVLAGSAIATSTYQGSGDLTIGSLPWNGSASSLPGSLDEVRVWNVARAQADVQATMNQSLTGQEPGLVAYWRLDEGAGSTASDSTGGFTGTLVNSPQWVVSRAGLTSLAPTATATATNTATATATATASNTPTVTATATETATTTSTATDTATATSTSTATGTATSTETSTATATPTDTATATATNTATGTATATNTATASPTGTATATATSTSTATATTTGTPTSTGTATSTPTSTSTSTATATPTDTATATATATASATQTATSTATPTTTSSSTATSSATAIATSTDTPTPSVTPTNTPGPSSNNPVNTQVTTIQAGVTSQSYVSGTPDATTLTGAITTVNDVAVNVSTGATITNGNFAVSIPPSTFASLGLANATVSILVAPPSTVTGLAGSVSASPNGTVVDIVIKGPDGHVVTVSPTAIQIFVKPNGADIAMLQGTQVALRSGFEDNAGATGAVDYSRLNAVYFVTAETSPVFNPLSLPPGTALFVHNFKYDPATGLASWDTQNLAGVVQAIVANPVSYVQTLNPEAQEYSSFDPAASQSFGTKPQFSYLQVVAPQIPGDNRLVVLDPDTGNYSYVNASDVAPSGPPPARAQSAVVRGLLEYPDESRR